MGTYRDIRSLLGRVEIEVNRANGIRIEIEGLAVILTVSLIDLAASIAFCTVQVP